MEVSSSWGCLTLTLISHGKGWQSICSVINTVQRKKDIKYSITLLKLHCFYNITFPLLLASRVLGQCSMESSLSHNTPGASPKKPGCMRSNCKCCYCCDWKLRVCYRVVFFHPKTNSEIEMQCRAWMLRRLWGWQVIRATEMHEYLSKNSLTSACWYKAKQIIPLVCSANSEFYELMI